MQWYTVTLVAKSLAFNKLVLVGVTMPEMVVETVFNYYNRDNYTINKIERNREYNAIIAEKNTGHLIATSTDNSWKED